MRLELSEPARDDLEEIWQYVAVDDEDAATRLVDVLINRLRTVQTFPGAGRERPELGPGTRSFPIHSNYVAYFLEGPKLVLILRILHGSRDVRMIFSE